MDEKFKKAVNDCLIPILSRFANGITDLHLAVKESPSGKKYYAIATDNIPMTPCVFKSLLIEGQGHPYTDEEGKERILWRFRWCWDCFGGGSNGTELVSITTSANTTCGLLMVFNISI